MTAKVTSRRCEMGVPLTAIHDLLPFKSRQWLKPSRSASVLNISCQKMTSIFPTSAIHNHTITWWSTWMLFEPLRYRQIKDKTPGRKPVNSDRSKSWETVSLIAEIILSVSVHLKAMTSTFTLCKRKHGVGRCYVSDLQNHLFGWLIIHGDSFL